MPAVDLSEFSEDELTGLIADATARRDALCRNREREAATGRFGSKGQDVLDPDHGPISAPTPNAVKEVAPEHGVSDVADQRR